MTHNPGQQSLFAETEDEKTAMATAKEPKAPAAGKAPDAPAERKPRDADGRERAGATAEAMAKRQREISVSEFFTKNRHLLGFDSPRKALLTAVKEAVDNSLDACEEARILPEVRIRISRIGQSEKQFTITVEDNGPGIVKAQVGNVFGRLLYGSKFHRLRQSRGQQGIGISAAGMYGQLTTGAPVRVRSKPGRKSVPTAFEIRIDTAKNRPDTKDWVIEWDKDHGTEVAIDLEGEYRRGQKSVEEFLKLCAVANPHVHLVYTDPDGNTTEYRRASNELPKEVEEIKPHPHGVELGILLKMIAESDNRTTSAFLQQDFSRVGPTTAKEICAAAGINPESNPRRLDTATVQKMKAAIDATKIMAPPLSCIAPIGEDLIVTGLKKEVEADFYVATSRKPVVYRGRPFAVEVGIAYGKPGDTLHLTDAGRIVEVAKKKPENDEALMGAADEPIRLIRYANRVPLVFQQSACAITKAVIDTNWKNYGLQQPRGALPVGPMVVFVHIASVWVPFTSESKEAIASYDEIRDELRLALMECGRKLGQHVRKGRKLASEFKKRNYIETYIPHLVVALQDILKLDDKQAQKARDNLTHVLEKSRKL
ncbi:MAG: DNA topoisomerase VI subunit B [Planctomycetes bacterium]|nr:DNA topoisomerase VI subunit B [Planctomycetota bacterium]